MKIKTGSADAYAVGPVSKPQTVLLSAATLGPYFLLILFGPEATPHRRRPRRAALLAQRVAVVWYLAAYVAACSVAMSDALSAPEVVFLPAALLGIWPCTIALSRWRIVR